LNGKRLAVSEAIRESFILAVTEEDQFRFSGPPQPKNNLRYPSPLFLRSMFSFAFPVYPDNDSSRVGGFITALPLSG